MKKLISALLAAALTLIAASCTAAPSESGLHAKDLMEDISSDISLPPIDKNDRTVPTALTDHALELFKKVIADGENTLISPLSVVCALTMLANGAEGNTAAELEAVLGVMTNPLTEWLSAYRKALPQSEKCALRIADSIWFTNDGRFTVNEDFLKTNAAYFGADIYSAPFDHTTVEDINAWVNGATDGMIDSVISEIPSAAVMYIINALAFDAEWQDKYEYHQVRGRIFTAEDGTQQDSVMMYSDEYKYMEDDNAVGFIKYYKGGDYAFAALLPREGMTVSEYLDTLDGDSLLSLVNGAVSAPVNAGIPKFSYDFDTELSDVLASLGMPSAFDENTAELSGLGRSAAGNIFVSRVIHKTFIEVAEAGTKAGAVTVIEAADGASEVIETPKTVILDRPFFYMIIECDTGLPIFMGVLAKP